MKARSGPDLGRLTPHPSRVPSAPLPGGSRGRCGTGGTRERRWELGLGLGSRGGLRAGRVTNVPGGAVDRRLRGKKRNSVPVT